MLSSAAALINALGLQIAVLLLSSLYGAQVVGQFSLVQRVLGIPLALVGHSVSQVFLSRAAAELRADVRGLHKLFLAVVKRLALLAAAPALVLAVAGPVLFAFVFGEEWREAGTYAQLMSLGWFGHFVLTPLASTLGVLERQDLSLLWNITRLFLVAQGIGVAYALGWSAQAAVGLYSAGMFSGYLALALLCLHAIRRRIRETTTFKEEP